MQSKVIFSMTGEELVAILRKVFQEVAGEQVKDPENIGVSFGTEDIPSVTMSYTREDQIRPPARSEPEPAGLDQVLPREPNGPFGGGNFRTHDDIEG
jgi:hypothetical protein